MTRCHLKGFLSLWVVVTFVSMLSLSWILLVVYTIGPLHDGYNRDNGGDVHAVFLKPPDGVSALGDEDNAYSSLYCVSHRFVHPTGLAAGGQQAQGNKSIDALRTDIILNGMFVTDEKNAWTLDESDVMGSPRNYYFPIYNRTCLYTYVYFDRVKNKFFFYLKNTLMHRQLLAEGKLRLPRVSLSSRPLELPRARAEKLRQKAMWAFTYSPVAVLGRRPRDASLNTVSDPNSSATAPYHNTLVGYYVPTVAPWNFAHTLLCDLFGFFWGHMELQLALSNLFPSEMKFLSDSLPDIQLIATSFRYYPKEPLPNSNKAFHFMSRRNPLYDLALPTGVYRALLAGTGTKSWSWVTTSYTASGSPALWYAFRHYIMRLTRAQQPAHRKELSTSSPFSLSPVSRRLHVCICYKKDKRGILNSNALQAFLAKRFEGDENVTFVVDSIVNQSAKKQVETMLASDVFVCNEGTLATLFFLMNPGSVFVAVPLVYHSPHLHQLRMPPHDQWWLRPDVIRVDPRYNTGGNIDWFPPSIPWVRVTWYTGFPLSETLIQSPLRGLRNYMPDYNVRVDPERFTSLMKRVIGFIRGAGSLWEVKICPSFLPHHTRLHSSSGNRKNISPSFEQLYQFLPVCLVPTNWTAMLTNTSLREVFYLHETDIELQRFSNRTHRPPNYSITADLCRRLLHLTPMLATGFNTVLCRYGMSWLCEFFANGRYNLRTFHDKWRSSAGWCGGNESWPGYWLQHPKALNSAVCLRAAAHKKSRGSGDNNKVLLDDLDEVKDYFFDVREELNLSQFLFFNKEDLLRSYREIDFTPLPSVDDEIVKKLFG